LIFNRKDFAMPATMRAFIELDGGSTSVDTVTGAELKRAVKQATETSPAGYYRDLRELLATFQRRGGTDRDLVMAKVRMAEREG